jgi:hypothetical protein
MRLKVTRGKSHLTEEFVSHTVFLTRAGSEEAGFTEDYCRCNGPLCTDTQLYRFRCYDRIPDRSILIAEVVYTVQFTY